MFTIFILNYHYAQASHIVSPILVVCHHGLACHGFPLGGGKSEVLIERSYVRLLLRTLRVFFSLLIPLLLSE